MTRRRLPKRYRGGRDSCLRECVARLMGKPPGRVPHFVGLYGGRWPWYLARWLRRHGFSMLIVRRAEVYNVPRWINLGPTRAGGHHAVLMSARKHHGRGGVEWDGGVTLRRVEKSLFIFRRT